MGSKSALTRQRRKLKVRLWEERAASTEIWDGADFFVTVAEMPYSMPLPVGVICLPICPYCGKAILHPDHCVMHEVFIRRAALPVKLQYLIMHECNCVLVHFQCHEDHETTREFKLRCAEAQFARYGRAEIVAWVGSLGLRQTVYIPTEEEANAND